MNTHFKDTCRIIQNINKKIKEKEKYHWPPSFWSSAAQKHHLDESVEAPQWGVNKTIYIRNLYKTITLLYWITNQNKQQRSNYKDFISWRGMLPAHIRKKLLLKMFLMPSQLWHDWILDQCISKRILQL